MRCPMTRQGTANKIVPVQKQCMSPAEVKVCIPLKAFEDHTEIAYTKICTLHFAMIQNVKNATIRRLNAGPLVPTSLISGNGRGH